MQVFGNVATLPERKVSKATNRGYFEFRIAESHRSGNSSRSGNGNGDVNRAVDSEPTWYTVRVMKDAELGLGKGDFVKVTGRLKADFYLSREGKPTGTLLIIAFDAAKIAKASVTAPQQA